MIKFLKELVIPSGEKITVDAYHSWTVRWHKLDSYRFSSGGFNFTETPEAEVFTSVEDANKFADQLQEAYKLLRITGDITKVKVSANQ